MSFADKFTKEVEDKLLLDLKKVKPATSPSMVDSSTAQFGFKKIKQPNVTP